MRGVRLVSWCVACVSAVRGCSVWRCVRVVCACWCVRVVCVLVCACWCVRVVCACCVCCVVFVCSCGTLKTSVCAFNTSPCVRSKRSRVYRQHAHMDKTCGHVAGTHGDILNAYTGTCWMHTRRERGEEGRGRERRVIASSPHQNGPRRVITWPQRGSPKATFGSYPNKVWE